MEVKASIAVLDFGSQYTQLIAKKLRQMGVFSYLFPYNVPIEELKNKNIKGIILSGGPHSVNDEKAPLRDLKELLELAPVMGVCYGMQLIAKEFGGKVVTAEQKEYGLNEVHWSFSSRQLSEDSTLRKKFEKQVKQKVWMSHGDVMEKPPKGFEVIATSLTGHPGAMIGEFNDKKILAVQFHPEVTHTEYGESVLEEFVFNFCKLKNEWTAPAVVEHLIEKIKQQVGETEHVLCALSGGVDSTVVGTLLTKALGAEKVHCVFVNNGLLRKNEFLNVLELYKNMGLNVDGVDAENDFLEALAGVSDPEKKRKIIGHKFIDVFKESISKMKSDERSEIKYLAQGTLYPDVIESVSPRGESVTIKSHHNVGGLPKDLNLELVEPLRELFKDEVRAIGKELGIPKENLWRHPFPGPGLAIRVMGALSKEDLDTLRECDAIYIDELKKHNLYDEIWQAFCVLLPVQTVGVQGDNRTYAKVLSLRAVTSHDGMTADWFDFPAKFLRYVSNRITNEVSSVNRVVYDVTSKPPGTIEWE